MILKLKNEQQFLLSYFSDNEEYINLQVLNCLTSMLVQECTEENLEEVQIIENDKIVAVYRNLYLDSDIGYSISTNTTSFKLCKYKLATRIENIKSTIKNVELLQKNISSLENQLTQAQADIAYISVLSDIDTTTTEEETPNESGI